MTEVIQFDIGESKHVRDRDFRVSAYDIQPDFR